MIRSPGSFSDVPPSMVAEEFLVSNCGQSGDADSFNSSVCGVRLPVDAGRGVVVWSFPSDSSSLSSAVH